MRVHVVAGALYDARGRVLITQRPAGKPLAGRWEFPGGKIHDGEAPYAGLVRELREELAVDVTPRETLLVTAPGGVLLHVTPVSSSLTLDYVDATRSLGVWIEVENAGDVDWSGAFGADATLTVEIGNTFLPVAEPTPADLHPDPARYGYANRNLMQPIDLPAGERTQGVLVFRPTLGNRPASLNVTLDGERTTSWVVNIGQL